MYIISNNRATAANYAQSVLSNPKIQLTEQQKSDVDAIAKKHNAQKSETYTKAASLTSFTANPYNPFYGVKEPANPYNYSAEEMLQSNPRSNLRSVNFTKINAQLDNKQNVAVRKFHFLRSQL